VTLNGTPISYNAESLGNAWLVSFSYQTGINDVAVGVNAADSIRVNVTQIVQWIPCGVIIVLLALIAVLLVSKKTKNYENLANITLMKNTISNVRLFDKSFMLAKE
jgi:hypothetical protein